MSETTLRLIDGNGHTPSQPDILSVAREVEELAGCLAELIGFVADMHAHLYTGEAK